MAGKGTQVGMYEIGQRVFTPFGVATIGKLHRSGRHGSAEVSPLAGGRKRTVRLQHVAKAQ